MRSALTARRGREPVGAPELEVVDGRRQTAVPAQATLGADALTVLLVEDDDADALVVRELLSDVVPLTAAPLAVGAPEASLSGSAQGRHDARTARAGSTRAGIGTPDVAGPNVADQNDTEPPARRTS
ncbi:hypothetical protein LWC33_34000 [Pseudonocardia sp. RS11V-5]|uniref:hypothetical protein n=1 Tax=Pseudonocardia terrae TaxID=2905831 RepID=UPI001E38C8FB|nr:hypothetical protein [Pseudonocardia terrae]MCE3556441.1 hypothetical protein [Pseudonocardia terrae]